MKNYDFFTHPSPLPGTVLGTGRGARACGRRARGARPGTGRGTGRRRGAEGRPAGTGRREASRGQSGLRSASGASGRCVGFNGGGHSSWCRARGGRAWAWAPGAEARREGAHGKGAQPGPGAPAARGAGGGVLARTSPQVQGPPGAVSEAWPGPVRTCRAPRARRTWRAPSELTGQTRRPCHAAVTGDSVGAP